MIIISVILRRKGIKGFYAILRFKAQRFDFVKFYYSVLFE